MAYWIKMQIPLLKNVDKGTSESCASCLALHTRETTCNTMFILNNIPYTERMNIPSPPLCFMLKTAVTTF